MFVFINTYRQATHLEDPQLRMIHTIQTAGKATFFTSLTTAAAYAANVFSQVRSLPKVLYLAAHPPPHGPLLTQHLHLKALAVAPQPISAATHHYKTNK